MRNKLWFSIVGALIFGALIFVAWMLFKDWPPVNKAHAPAARSLRELADLVYREPFNPQYQLEMSRAQYRRFEESMKTDEEAFSRCLTAAMAACFMGGSRSACDEAQQRYKEGIQLASLPDVPFDIFYENSKPIFDLTINNVKRIIDFSISFDYVLLRSVNANGPHTELGAARKAVETYLRMLYEVEFGIRRIAGRGSSEDSHFKFGTAFYDEWELGMRSYGQVLQARHNPIDDFHLKGTIDGLHAFDVGFQIPSGESIGRFGMSNGDEILPGIKYFEDRGAVASQGGASKSVAASAQTAAPDLPAGRIDNPSDAYRHFRFLQTQEKWSEMYAMFETESRKRMTEQTKIMLRSMMPDEKNRQKLDMISGENLFAVIQQNTSQHPVEIISEDVTGDKAALKVRHLAADRELITTVHLVRVDGLWKMLWSAE